MRTLTLGERGSDDPALVGNKAARLAQLAGAYRVPPAFCLTASVYDALRRALDTDGDGERATLGRLVAESYAALGRRVGVAEPRVAVRSSAIGEDGADASFAGQHETILNVSGAASVTAAVLECWRSLDAERVAAYRRERGIEEPPRIAVLVQQMVDADVSAIAFGVDPVSGDDSVVVIDAAAGLGDRIASGEITPDRYVVRKADRTVVTRPEGGALSDGEVGAIAGLVLDLTARSGGPVDVECAVAGGSVFLLQCRPVTTLASEFVVEWRDPKDAQLNWSRDDAHFGAPQPQLMCDLLANAAPYGMRHRARVFAAPFVMRLEPFNGRPYLTVHMLASRDELPERTKAFQARVRAHAREVRRLWDDDYLPRLLANFAWMRAIDVENAPLAELAGSWEGLVGRIRESWAIHMMVTGGAYPAMNELAETYAKLTGGDGLDALKLTQGLAPTLHQLERDLHALAERARRTPAIARALEAASLASLDELRAIDGGGALASAIERFLEAHGDLGHAGEDLTSHSWADDVTLLFAELARRLAAPGEDPDARRERLLAEGAAVEARARETLRSRPADLAAFEEILTVARAAGPLTEEHNYWLDRKIQSHLARILRALGARMAREGLIDRPDDLSHLRIAEIADALRAPRDLRPLVRLRAAEFARWRRMRPPKQIGNPDAPAGLATRMDLQYRAPRQDGDVIKGVAASRGVRRGAARLVRGTEDFAKMRRGDVLVCRSSNVSWIPLFTLAAAVVTDVGGALSHAAVVAREFGVPAVTGVGVAFERLRDGMIVEVNGDEGTVRVI